MKNSTLTFIALFLTTLVFSQLKNDWENPNVNQINRLPSVATFYNFENESQAISGERESSKYYNLVLETRKKTPQ